MLTLQCIVYLFIFTQRSFTWNSHGRQISSDSPTAWSWQIRRKYSKSIIHWRMYTVTKLLYFPNNHWKKRRLKRDMFCNEHFIFIIFFVHFHKKMFRPNRNKQYCGEKKWTVLHYFYPIYCFKEIKFYWKGKFSYYY